jgi:hypothetical protein
MRLERIGQVGRTLALGGGASQRAPSGGSSHQLWLRHPTSPLPLLPSGPDGIHD